MKRHLDFLPIRQLIRDIRDVLHLFFVESGLLHPAGAFFDICGNHLLHVLLVTLSCFREVQRCYLQQKIGVSETEMLYNHMHAAGKDIGLAAQYLDVSCWTFGSLECVPRTQLKAARLLDCSLHALVQGGSTQWGPADALLKHVSIVNSSNCCNSTGDTMSWRDQPVFPQRATMVMLLW